MDEPASRLPGVSDRQPDRGSPSLLIDAPAVLGWNSWRQQDSEASRVHLTQALAELAERGLITLSSVSGASALLSGEMNEAALCI